MHIDCNEEQGILIYPYFRDTLLGLIKGDPAFPLEERKRSCGVLGRPYRNFIGRTGFISVCFLLSKI